MKPFIILLLTLFYLTFVPNLFAQEQSEKNKSQTADSEVRNDSPAFLPEGTIIHKRTKDKIYCFLPRNIEIQGILCRGDSNRGWETEFYSNGKLAKAWPAKTEEIQGIPCMEASFWTEVFGRDAAVYFYPNGKLAKCKLAKDTTIDGHAFEKGDHVRFDQEGKLILEK